MENLSNEEKCALANEAGGDAVPDEEDEFHGKDPGDPIDNPPKKKAPKICDEKEMFKKDIKKLQEKIKTLEAENEQIKGFNARCIRKLETIAGVLQI